MWLNVQCVCVWIRNAVHVCCCSHSEDKHLDPWLIHFLFILLLFELKESSVSGWFTFSFFSVWLCGSGETPERSAYTFSPYELKNVWELDHTAAHTHTYSTANGPQLKIPWGRVTRRLLWRYLRKRANGKLVELKDWCESGWIIFSSPQMKKQTNKKTCY